MKKAILKFLKPGYKKILLALLFFALFLVFRGSVIDDTMHQKWHYAMDNILEDGPLGFILFDFLFFYILSCTAVSWNKLWKRKTKLLIVFLKIIIFASLFLTTIWQGTNFGFSSEGFLEILASIFLAIQLCLFFIVIPLAFLIFLGLVMSIIKKPLVSFFIGLGMSLSFVAASLALILWGDITNDAVEAFFLLAFFVIIGLIGIIESAIISIKKSKNINHETNNS